MSFRQPHSSPFDGRNLDAAPPGPLVFADEFVFGGAQLFQEGTLVPLRPNAVAMPSPYVVWDPTGMLDDIPPWVDQRRQCLMLAINPPVGGADAYQWAGAIRPIPPFTAEQLDESEFQIYGRTGAVRSVLADLADPDGETQYGMIITDEADFGVEGDGKFLSAGWFAGDRLVLPSSREWVSSNVASGSPTQLQTAMGGWMPMRMVLTFNGGECTVRVEVSMTGEGWFPIDSYTMPNGPPVWVGIGGTGFRQEGSGGTFALDYLRMYDTTELDGELVTDGARLYGGQGS